MQTAVRPHTANYRLHQGYINQGAISPKAVCVKSASAKLFLDLHTVSAPKYASGEERKLDAAAQVERRNALDALLPPL